MRNARIVIVSSGSDRPRRHRCRHQGRRVGGQATSEYLILGMLVAIALVIGEPSPLEELFRAIQTQYGRFTMALSLP